MSKPKKHLFKSIVSFQLFVSTGLLFDISLLAGGHRVFGGFTLAFGAVGFLVAIYLYKTEVGDINYVGKE